MDDEILQDLPNDGNDNTDGTIAQTEAIGQADCPPSPNETENDSPSALLPETELTGSMEDESDGEENPDIAFNVAKQAETTPATEGNDEKSVSSDLIRGHINTIILRSLYDGDKYGYAIIAEIERKSHKQYQLKQPSLYSALKRLEKDGYITSYWGGSVNGGRRKYFSLTDEGKAVAERNQTEWEYSRTVIDSLISDRDFDFEQPAPSAVDMRVLKQSTSRVPVGEHDDEFFDDTFDDEADVSSPSQSVNPTNEEIEKQRLAFEAERTKIEEELRAREEALRAEEEARAVRAEEQARLIEELRVREEALSAREEAIRNQTAEQPVAQPTEQVTEQVAEQTAQPVEQPATQLTEQVTEQVAEQAAQPVEQPVAQPTEQATEQVAEQTAQSAEQPAAQPTEQATEQTTESADFRYWKEWRAMEAARLEEEAYLKIQAEAVARARYDEEVRRRQDAYRLSAQEQQTAQEALEQQRIRQAAEEAAATATKQTEAEQAAKEQLLREKEARLRAEEVRLQEERARFFSMNGEKEQQNAHIMETQTFLKEREQYERKIEEREAELRNHYETELARQEERLRREAEETYRQREMELLHKNYLDLVQNPRVGEDKPDYTYYNGPKAVSSNPMPDIYAAKPEEEREYRNIIQKIYGNATPPVGSAPLPPEPKAERPIAPATVRKPTEQLPKQSPAETAIPEEAPAAKAETKAVRSLDGMDFYDLETRAAQDGIRIAISGLRTKAPSRNLSTNLVHKGKALFISALITFLICLAEGSVTLGLLRSLSLPRVYPFLIWGAGLAVLLVTGLAYLNHYGERALRKTGNLLVNAIVVYALCIVVVLILALAMQIDFSNVGQLMANVVIPIVFLLNIVVFAVAYYLQIKPKKE